MNLLVHTLASPATENGSEKESSRKTWLVQIVTLALPENQTETRRRSVKTAESSLSLVR